MANRKRSIQIIFRVDEQERAHINKKMEKCGTSNMQAYLRKMALDGYILNVDMKPILEINSLLRINANNLNQIAKRVNETNSIYKEDIDELKGRQAELWTAFHDLLKKIERI